MLSVILTSCNEGNELLWTIENVLMHAGCACEVVVVDDASEDGSARYLPDGVKVIRNDPPREGVAPARRKAIRHAEGDTLLVLDAHMRIPHGAGARLREEALDVGGLVVAGLGNLYGSDRTFWNTGMRVNPDKARLATQWGALPEGEGLRPIYGFVAPGYVITREAYERVGGWPSMLRNWGQTEVTLSLKLCLADVPMRVDPEVKVLHRFRSNDEVPYRGMSTFDVLRNNYVMCRTCFEESFEEFWLPLMRTHKHWRDDFCVWSEEAEAERDAYQRVKVLDDEEFFERVLGMSMAQAKERYL